MKLRWISLLALLALLTSGSAFASEGRFYLGATAGQWVGDEGPQFDYFGFEVNQTDDDIVNAYGGLRLNERFALEVGYHDLGSFGCCDYSTADFIIAPPFFQFDREGYSVAAVGSLPVGRFAFFAKAGLLFWERDGVMIQHFQTQRLSEEGTHSLVGVGVNFEVASVVDLRAQWELSEVDGQELQAVTAGVQFSF